MNGQQSQASLNDQPIFGLAIRFWPALLIGSAWLWLFWPMMTGRTVCGFRDSAYLYYPLFQWIDAQWASGEIPLWNPYCNYGMPVVGDGSTSVFYPGKLIFFCRFLSYPSRYGIYLAMHIPIAAWGTYFLARTSRASKAGATLAAVGYAFGGAVLFQATNVIFLVSAAWLPLAVCCVWKMVRTRSVRFAVAAGVCCALMILGGDPQMTYHVGLIAVATVLWEAWRVRRRGYRTQQREKRAWRFLFRGATLLGVMVLTTSLLAAIQIIPTYQWSQRSERTNPSQPANLFQAALNLPVDARAAYGLIGEPDGTIDHAYQFSKEPWSLLELFWPNFCGQPFPVNQRWTNRFPGSDRIWIPSVYMGVLVALVGLTGIRFWGRRRRNVWLTWLLLVFLIGSLGWYGPVWLYNEIFPQPEPPYGWTPMPTVGPQVGGVYWLMQMVLPKYFAFRYPAKLFVMASLALSILAGISLRRLRFRNCAFVFSVFAIVSLVQYGLVRQIIPVDPGSLPMSIVSIDDTFFGPYDSQGALSAATFWLVQTICVAGLACLSFLLAARFVRSGAAELPVSRRAIGLAHFGLVLLTLVDITAANRWMLAEVPAAVFETPTKIGAQIEARKSKQTDQAPLWLFRHRHQPVPPWEWEQNSSQTRLEEVVTWQRETLYPKHHLQHGVTLIGSFCSVWPIYYERELSSFENAVRHEMSENAIRTPGLIGGELAGASTNQSLVSPIIWLGNNSTDQGPTPIPVELTAFSSSRVTARVQADGAGWLAFGRIAEPGWSAKVRRIVDKAVDEAIEASDYQPRDLVLDRQQETLFLDFDSAGDYEVEFSYLPAGFVIGSVVSLISLIGLICWCSVIGWRARCLSHV